jgi:DNA processing protein
VLLRSDGSGPSAFSDLPSSASHQGVSSMDLQRAVALSLLPGISRPRAFAAWKELRFEPGDVLEHVVRFCAPGIDTENAMARALQDARGLFDAAAQRGIQLVGFDDERYPPLLRAIPDSPPVLWVRGRADVLAEPAVAIIGSRAATPYAVEIAARLAADVAAKGLMVVSGLARGVDGAAHRGSLSAGGRTLAVLGCGPDVTYPPEHLELYGEVARSGALVSELGPGAPPLPEHFPLRNRLISGISLGVVVVEASEKSGSLITARCALEQGRSVMAVPGSVLSGRNRGSHALLRDGAKVVETVDDILEELGWVGGPAGTAEASNPLKTDPLLAGMVNGETYSLDELSQVLGLDGHDLLARLTDWELQGRVKRLPGGRFSIYG